MSNPLRRLLASPLAWIAFADSAALGAGFLVVLWFRPGWCGAESVHLVTALVTVLTATSGRPSAERSLRNIALVTAMTAATVALAILAAALLAGCAGLAAWLGWHPAIAQGIVMFPVAVAGSVARQWTAMRLGMAGDEAATGGPRP